MVTGIPAFDGIFNYSGANRFYFSFIPDIIDPAFGRAFIISSALKLMAGKPGFPFTMYGFVTLFPPACPHRLKNPAVVPGVEIAGKHLYKIRLVLRALFHHH